MPVWYSAPPLWLATILIVVGFVALIKGADVLVVGAVALAKRFDLTPAVIGATVVAFGTSLPELMVSVFSLLTAVREGTAGFPDGPAAIAVANVVGSNIFNIGAVLGLAAVIRLLPVEPTTKRIDFPLALVSGFALVLMSLPLAGGPMWISRGEGLVLLFGLLCFIVLSIRYGKVNKDLPAETPGPLFAAILRIGLGITLLAIGGEVTLNGALTLARDGIGMSERVIGLTVMAIGTSLPELVTSVQAARRGQSAMAVANVLGSNGFNVFCIIGLSALITPLPVASDILWCDYPWMLLFVCALIPAMWLRGHIGRPTGFTLLGLLTGYIALILWQDLG